jgi:hypothetical protein
MELWMVLGLALAGLAIGVASRLRNSRRREPDKETKNIYPLW